MMYDKSCLRALKSQLNLPQGTKENKNSNERNLKNKTDML